MDNVGNLYIANGNIESAESMKEIDAQKYQTVYEVIRIMDRVPLYLEDHYKRLEKSHLLLGLKLEMDQPELKNQIQRLVDASQLKDCNVKLIVYHHENMQRHMIYISQSYYPSMDEVNTGVHVSLMQWVRQDPNIKIVNQKYKEEVNRKIKDNHAFEVLLINGENKITEGSRSNAFFIKDSKVYTAPRDVVLKGITRKYILEACKRVGVEVIENTVGVEMLSDIEGLFISGTSIKVLPVASIDSRRYNSSTNPVIVSIRDEFDKMIREYIDTH